MKKSELKAIIKEAINEVDFTGKLNPATKSKATKLLGQLENMLDDGGLNNNSKVFTIIDQLNSELKKA